MLTDVLRKVILGKKEKFLFTHYQEGTIDFNEINGEIGLYIHIPFCKTLCPYCPYNKIVYKADTAQKYQQALIQELALYKDKMNHRTISSIYIGGGTPTLLVSELKEIIQYIKEYYYFNGDIGIEVYPTEVNRELLEALKKMGVNLISLGVQTFNDEKLRFLGRHYTQKDINAAISLVKAFDFKCLDVDMMSNIPGQTIEDIKYDVKTVFSYDIDQLSIYPLIVFPLTDMASVIKQRGLSRFGEIEEKRILAIIDEIAGEYGYKRTSIWTYGKGDDNRYTSVTRESFVGLGAGASSHFGNYFYLNTFDVEAYINVLHNESLPINIVNVMTEKEKMIFWLFWRCYDGVIDANRFQQLFNKNMKKEFKLLFTALKLMGLSKKEGAKIVLTDWGRFAYHFIEKQYSIHYLNTVWQKSMEQPWIKELRI